MRMVDLSMPIWDGAGYGEILPMPNTPVHLFEYMTYDQHGMRCTELKIDDESGSPFMTIWQRAPHTTGPLEDGGRYLWKLDEVPLERLVLRDCAVLDVPGSDGYEITGEDIDRAVAAADFRKGDVALVRTGWATRQKAYELGVQYGLVGPSWSYDACMRMAAAMRERDSDIVMTDAPLIMTPAYQGWGWSTGPDRIVPMPRPWPSIESRERLLDLPAQNDPTKTEQPQRPGHLAKGGYREWITDVIAICKCLVDADQLTANRVRMIMMPLLVRGGGAAPCRFIAVED
jgi:kynurenine formamidase